MKMDIYEIVKKLAGPIDPIGETNADNNKFDNLKAITRLVDKLITDIDNVADENKDRQEYSMKRAGRFADKFLAELLKDVDGGCNAILRRRKHKSF